MNQPVKFFSLTVFCTIVLLSATCQREQTRSRTFDTEEIRNADTALQQAIATKDLESTVSFYASDATLLPVAEPIVTGTKAIRKEWTHLFSIPDFQNKSKLTKVEVSSGGDLAYTQGTYETFLAGADGKPAIEHGKYVSVWKKQADGSWKIVTDIYNTDAPPPEHK